MRAESTVTVLADAEAVAAEAERRILAAAARAIAARGAFHLALAGGATPRRLHERLAAAGADWPRWHVWFGDERCVAPDHADSNYRMARETLLDRVPIPAAQIHPMYGGGEPAAAAAACAAALAAVPEEDGTPALDCVLLGMGEDGHTASLFPGCALLDDRTALAGICTAANGSTRITLAPRAIEAAREVIALVTGGNKAATLARVLSGRGTDLPIARLRPRGGLAWLVDAATAGEYIS